MSESESMLAGNGAGPHERLYLNRELSWLAFNARVLEQAKDPHWPLLERLKFVAIFGANLDEFFMIRVAGLHDQLAADVQNTEADGLSVRQQLVRLREAVIALSESASALLSGTLLPELAAAGIQIRAYSELSESAASFAREHFRTHVFPILTPLAVDPLHPFPFLSNLSLSLAVLAEDPVTHERRFARVKVPESLGRFVPIKTSSGDLRTDATGVESVELVSLEELIAGNLADLFPGMTLLGAWPFRVTRDMDLDILDDEAEDLLALVDREVRRRRFGAAVRLEMATAVPQHIRRVLLEKLELEPEDLYESEGFLGLQGLFALLQLPRKDLRDPPLRQRIPFAFKDLKDPFAAILAEDVLLHHPYDSFAPVLDLLRVAAEDANVLGIKMTLYRAGANSEAVRTLIRAAENGKQVAVSVELKARFDEENNIGWARALERAGAHVFYGSAGLKTHAKAVLIVRREAAGLRRYVHLSTGNYNASTAKLYTDLGLMTADPELGEDVSELFNTLSGFSKNIAYRKLAVAPRTLRSSILAKIAEQANRARSGANAGVFAKLNSLVDPEIIEALYQASRAGVPIELLVRGICCLRPKLRNVSENIRVFSMIGRFLEHERICAFGPRGEEEFFLSSADWMPRNLDRRVELLFPIREPTLCDRLRDECVRPLELDNCRVYEMEADGEYRVRRPSQGGVAVDGQLCAHERVMGLEAARSNGKPLQPRLESSAESREPTLTATA